MSILRKIQEIEQAKQICAKYAGALDGVYDSPAEVYRAALEKLGHDTSSLEDFDHTVAAKAAFDAMPGAKRLTSRRSVAMDAKATARLETMFPNMNRLHRG